MATMMANLVAFFDGPWRSLGKYRAMAGACSVGVSWSASHLAIAREVQSDGGKLDDASELDAHAPGDRSGSTERWRGGNASGLSYPWREG